jgi:DNA polymerase-3 subunit delta'
MLLREVIGHQTAKALFRQMLTSGRLPHALLLLAPPGAGALPLAWALAQRHLCSNPQDDDACGECSHCRKAAKLVHPDLHFSFPTVGTKVISDQLLPQWREAMLEHPYMEINDWLQHIGAENKQGNINKEECVNIVRKISLKSFESEEKILLMWLPEYLGNEGNRLLKLIEEPPERTTFILVAENQELILNTILSRCQLVKLQALPDEAVAAALQQDRGVSKAAAEAIAHLADGNYNDALTMAQQEDHDQARRFLDWMRCCYKGHPVEMTDWVDDFAGIGRENQKHFLRYALHFWREFLILKTLGKEHTRLRPNELKTAEGMTKVLSLAQLEEIVGLLDACSAHVARNAHPRVLFLDASIRIHRLFKQPKDRTAA